MPNFDVGIRKYEEFGKVQYWLRVIAKPIESDEDEKYSKVKLRKKPFCSYYIQLINAYYWKVFIICLIYLDILFCVTYVWLMSGSNLLAVIILMHSTCFFYWIDFIGAMIERVIERKRTEAKVRKIVFLVTDAISLLPLSTMYLLVSNKPNNGILWQMRIITTLRFYRILSFFSGLENVERDRWKISIAVYTSYMILLILLFANCFLYSINEYTPIHIKDWNKTTTNKIVVSLYYALEISLNVGHGDILPVSYTQIIINCAAMTIGFGMTIGLLNGILATSCVNRGKRREQFRYEYEATMNTLKERKIDKKVFETIKENMQMLWKYKEGFTDPPPVHILPLSLQKEIFFDINFGFLNRSIIFSKQPRSFLRSVSLLMKNITYLPGDIIVESLGRSEAMICIASGVVEILSEENDESVLFSLTTGTILGEAKLFLSIQNRCCIRASTYVEIQILKKVHFSHLALTYPNIYRSMRSEIYNRLQTTAQLIEFEKSMSSLDSDFQELFRWKGTKKFLKKLRSHSKENTREEILYKSEILNLYVLSENIPRVKTLPINLIRARPWILRPETTLTKLWNFFLAIVITVSVSIHPIWTAFHRTITPFMYVMLTMTYITYIIDLYLECTTAIEKKDHFTYITTVKEIIASKLKTFTFYFDILATYYLGIYANLIWPSHSDYAHLLLQLNGLLKTWRLILYMEKLKNNMNNNLLLFVTLKYIISFTILVIWGAALLYLEACPGETCLSDRWFAQKELQAVKNHDEVSCTTWPMTMSLYFATSTLFTVGFGDIVPTDLMDCLVVTLCMVLGIIVMIFCVAEISSAFKHLALKRTTYQEEIFAVNRFMSEHEIPKDLQVKVRNYLQLQWDYDKGYSMKQSNMEEVLPTIQRQILMMALTKVFLTVPLFRKTNADFIKLLAKLSKVRVLPPNEYVVEAGSFIREMYILEDGYCQISKEKEIAKVVGPTFCFGVLEMILGTQQQLNVSTLTHVKIVSLDYISYLKAVTKYPTIKEEIDQIIEKDFDKPESFYVSTFKTLKDKTNESEALSKQKELFSKEFLNVYKYYKSLQMSYWQPFRAWGKFRFFQFFILPFVITPDSLFLKIWMSMRIVNVLIISAIAPIQFCFPRHAKELMIFLTTQQAFAVVDVYLMFHTAYYNQKGLLMFHPAKTTTNYLKGTFVLDLITAFPYILIKTLTSEDSVMYPNIYLEVPVLLTILQLHKFFQACQYLERNILRKTELIQILKFIPLCLMVTNFITGFIILLECTEMQKTGNAQLVGNIRLAKDYKKILKKFCLSSTYGNHTLNDDAAVKLYLTTFYWVTSNMMGCGFGDLNPQSEASMIYAIITVILGIFFYTYKFASISSSMVNTNVLVTKRRRKILLMSKFMKNKNVKPDLQKRILLHYVHDWQRKEGASPQTVFTSVNAALREKIVASMYEATVRQVPGFENLEKIIIRIIGKNLNEMYFLGGETIVNYNDVQEYIYLIYRGKVDLYSHDGELITTMGRGGLFGNISNKSFSLSSEVVIAAENVDVLRLECKIFFQSLKVFSTAKALINYLTSVKTNYIKPKTETNVATSSSSSSTIKLNLLHIHRIQHEHLKLTTTINLEKNAFYLKNNIFKHSGKPIHAFVILPESLLHDGIGACLFGMAYLSVTLTVYSFAFQDVSTYVLLVSYASDFVFAVELFLQFHMSYFNRFGECVVSQKEIKKRYLNSKKLFYDIVSNLPLEILAVFFRKYRTQLLSALRLNRIMRLHYIFEYYNLKQNNLMTNNIILQLCWIFTMATLMVHFFGCIWTVAVYPFGHWQEPTWVTDMNLTKREKWELYVYSVYHLIILTTSAGQQVLPIYSSQELVLEIIFMIICRLCVVLLTSLLVATINAQSLNLFLFQDRIAELRTNFKRQNISEYQLEKMWNYAKKLWSSENGKQIPKFISMAPYAMKCELMNEMFGNHLSQSYIFSNTDKTFLRQLATHLRRFVYFSGNYIVQQGDIDDTMYFIHKGEVSVLTIHPDLMETIHFALGEKDNFGVKQGLIRGQVHNFSFRAETDVEILSLTLSHWQHLLKYFPHVEKKINTRLESLPSMQPPSK